MLPRGKPSDDRLRVFTCCPRPKCCPVRRTLLRPNCTHGMQVHRCGVLHGDIALRNFVLAAPPAGGGGGKQDWRSGSQEASSGQQAQRQPLVLLLDFGEAEHHKKMLFQSAILQPYSLVSLLAHKPQHPAQYSACFCVYQFPRSLSPAFRARPVGGRGGRGAGRGARRAHRAGEDGAAGPAGLGASFLPSPAGGGCLRHLRVLGCGGRSGPGGRRWRPAPAAAARLAKPRRGARPLGSGKQAGQSRR